MPGRLEAIFVAPARAAPMQALNAAEAKAGVGLTGDRYARVKNRFSEESQLTLIESEHVEAFVRETGLALEASGPRRNLLTRGVRLNGLVGKRFFVGSVELEGRELCEPCKVFARRTHAEALPWFAGKGGLRARIVTGGVLRVGDAIEAAPP